MKDLKTKITTELLAEDQTSLKTELDTLKEECMASYTAIAEAVDLTSYTAMPYIQNAVF